MDKRREIRGPHTERRPGRLARIAAAGFGVMLLAACAAAGAEEEVFLNQSRDLDNRIRFLSSSQDERPLEARLESLRRIQADIRHAATLFHRLDSGRHVEIRQALQARFAAFPADLRNAHQATVDPLADALWGEGVPREADLLELLDRYPLASRAPAAARQLARMYAEEGRFARALQTLRKARPGGTFPAPADAQLAAFCYARLGWSDGVRRCLRVLSRGADPGLGEVLAGARYGLADREPSLPEDGGFTPVPGPVLFSGSPDLGGDAAAGLPPPAYRPIRAGDIWILPFRRTVLALSASSGKRRWRFPEKPAHFARGSMIDPAVGAAVLGDRVAVSMGTALVVFHLKTGKVLWHYGRWGPLVSRPGEKEAVPDELPRPAALSVPVADASGFRVAAVSVKGARECYLLHFRPDGSWYAPLFLASGPAPIDFGHVERPTLARHRDGIYVDTGLGAVVAIDPKGPRFQWGIAERPMFSAMRTALDTTGRAVRSAPPLAAPPLLFVTSRALGELVAYDDTSGETAWRLPLAAGSGTVGLDGDVLVVGGPSGLSGLDRLSGRTLWTRRLDEPCGRAVLTPGRVHVPCRNGLLTLSVATGRTLSDLPLHWDGDRRRLVAIGKVLVAVGHDGIRVFSDGTMARGGRAAFLTALGRGRYSKALLLAGEDMSLTDVDLFGAVHRACDQGDAPSAAAFFEIARSRHPGSEALAAALSALARSAAETGRLRDALSRFEEALVQAASSHVPPAVRLEIVRAFRGFLRDHEDMRARWIAMTEQAAPALGRSDVEALVATMPFGAVPALEKGASRAARAARVREMARRGIRSGADKNALSEMAGLLGGMSAAEADRAYALMGRPGREEAFLEPPRIAWDGGDLLWHMPASGSEVKLVRPRMLPDPSRPVSPPVFTAGASHLDRVDARFGFPLWRLPLGTWAGEAAWVGGRLVVATSDSVKALDAKTSEIAWSAEVDLRDRGLRPMSSGGDYRLLPGRSSVAVVFRTGKIAAYDGETGTPRWEHRFEQGNHRAVFQDPSTGEVTVLFTGGEIARFHPDRGIKEDPAPAPAPVIIEGHCFGAGAKRVLALSPHGATTTARLVTVPDGETIWETEIGYGLYQDALVDGASGLACLLPVSSPSPSRPVLGLDLVSGKIVWNAEPPDRLDGGIAADGKAYLLINGPAIWTVSLPSGATLWRQSLSPGSWAVKHAMVATPFLLAVGTENRGVFLLNPETGKTRIRVAEDLGRVRELGVAGEMLMVAGERGTRFYGLPPRPDEVVLLEETPGLPCHVATFWAKGGFSGSWKAGECLFRSLRRDETVSRPASERGYLLARDAREGLAFAGHRPVRAVRLPAPAVPDGRLEEPWLGAAAVRLGLADVNFLADSPAGARWRGEADLSATVYTGWDENAFYLTVDVIDDRQVPLDQDARQWTGDALIIALDRLGDGGFRLRPPEDSVFWIFRSKPKKERQPRPDPPEAAAAQERMKILDRPGGNGVVYEIALPWEENFNRDLRRSGNRARQIRPRPGIGFGLNLIILDDDGDGPQKYLNLAPGLPLERLQATSFHEGTWPQLWARVTLD